MWRNDHWCSAGEHACEGCVREKRIQDIVEAAKRIIPLVIDAIREYDKESRQ